MLAMLRVSSGGAPKRPLVLVDAAFMVARERQRIYDQIELIDADLDYWKTYGKELCFTHQDKMELYYIIGKLEEKLDKLNFLI